MATTSDLAKEEGIGPLGVFAPPEISIECEAFSGSLGMLFQCVRERKIDLLGVPLAPICEAYFLYLVDQAKEDLEAAAVALVALSYLLERKAWMLLPMPETEEPDGDEWLESVEPYIQEFQPLILALRDKELERDSLFFRQSDGKAYPYELPIDTTDVSPMHLAEAFESLLRRANPDPPDTFDRPRRSLTEQMMVVMQVLPTTFKPLDEIVVGEFTRSEVVWWFLALLELIRLGQARVKVESSAVLFAKGGAD